MNPDRRRLIISAAGVAVGGMATARLLPEEMLLRDRRPRRSRVAIIAARGILRESRRGAGVGPSGVSPELARKIRTAQTEPSGIHRRRGSQYESRAGECCGPGISQAGRRQRRSGRGSWAPARHISGARRERARRSTAQPEDQFRRSEPRRIVQGANESHLHGSGTPMAAWDCTQI